MDSVYNTPLSNTDVKPEDLGKVKGLANTSVFLGKYLLVA